MTKQFAGGSLLRDGAGGLVAAGKEKAADLVERLQRKEGTAEGSEEGRENVERT